VLNLRLVEYEEGYDLELVTNHAYEAVRWSLDYFLKAHVAPHEFYGQTGERRIDHGYWGNERIGISSFFGVK